MVTVEMQWSDVAMGQKDLQLTTAVSDGPNLQPTLVQGLAKYLT